MAQSVLIPLKTVFDDKGLKQAQASFGKLGSSLKGIVGAAGIAVGLGAIVSSLKDATKAASEDVKSQALLAQQLRNTVGASKEQIDSVEASIAAMELQAAVADDVIRPAFASLVRSTGDVTQATQLTSLALDVAAGTGKDLGSVSLALGKAINGSATSLIKLVPSIKGASDPIAELTKQFNGAAKAAADNDPYAQLTVVFGRLQEQIGTYLLPYLEDFASYITSPEGQAALTEFGDGVGTIADNVLKLGKNLGSDEFLSGLASFSSFLAQLSGGEFGGALTTLNKRQDELSTSFETPYMRDLRLSAKSNSSNKEIAATAKKEIAAVSKAEKSTRAAYNRFASLNEVGKKLGLNVYSTGEALKGSGFIPEKVDGSTSGSKKTDNSAKIAADKAAKARQAVIKAAQEASDQAKQAFDDLKTSVKEFNDTFDATANGFRTVFKFAQSLGEFESQAVDAFKSIKDAADQAFASGLIDDKALANLKAYADKESALLVSIAKQRDQLAKKISIAESVTAGVMGSLDINSMLSAETKTVSKSVTSIVNGIALTTTQSFDEVVTGGLAASFKKLVDKTKTFAGNLVKLKQLGLNGTLFKQIVEGGAEAGGATAEAIIAGGADAVKELNGLFGELTKAGSDIAATSTPVLYDLGENMTNSFIDGLRSQDQVLIATANSMAALFTEQFKTNLNLAIAPTIATAQSTAMNAQMAVDLTSRPDPKRSPQAYQAWLSGIGGIDPMRSPESYAKAQAASNTYNVTINANAITDKQSLPALVTDALLTATKQGITGGLATRLLAV